MGKKKKGAQVSGDLRKRAAAEAKTTMREVRTLKLREFIDMENPLDVDQLRAEAIELKSDDINDDFLQWYQDKTGAGTESLFGQAFNSHQFFELLLDIGAKNPETGNINLNVIISLFKEPFSTLPHMPAAWSGGQDEYQFLTSLLTEFLAQRGYIENFDDFLTLDEYIEQALDNDYSFFDNEPAVFSFSGRV
ncbi:MAG TPA: hypothetical protein VGI71_14345 [Scandinavium sp.]|jgi:hypothetical protein